MSTREYYHPTELVDSNNQLVVEFLAPYSDCSVTGTSTTLLPGSTMHDFPEYQPGDHIFSLVVEETSEPQGSDSVMQRLTSFATDTTGKAVNVLVIAKGGDGRVKKKRAIRTENVY